jgi:serine/threonine protein kinase
VYLQEEKEEVFDGHSYYCFSVVYPKKTRYYYVDSLEEYQNWVSVIKRATGYADLNDIFEVREKLGNGNFGLVRLGIHKHTGRKVAIKIMTKKDMDNKDLELVKTEIDILKICQHPNIIKLYDVFENVDYIYISKLFLTQLWNIALEVISSAILKREVLNYLN